MSDYKKLLLVSIVPALLFIVDRFFKYLFLVPLYDSNGILIFQDWFRLKLAFNPGIAFGIGVNFYLIIISYIFILSGLGFLTIRAVKEKAWSEIFFLFLIILGALSNLADRLGAGAVIDYFDLKYYSVFNLADVMIVGGAIGVFVLLFKRDRLKKS